MERRATSSGVTINQNSRAREPRSAVVKEAARVKTEAFKLND